MRGQPYISFSTTPTQAEAFEYEKRRREMEIFKLIIELFKDG